VVGQGGAGELQSKPIVENLRAFAEDLGAGRAIRAEGRPARPPWK